MKCYIISYDLVDEKNYEKLYKAIKDCGHWAKITESTWAVVTDKSASEIRNRLAEVMDADDRLIVTLSGGEGAWRNSACTNEWLKKNL